MCIPIIGAMHMSTATALKASVSNLRNRVKIDEAEARRSGAAFLSAFLIGTMERPREGDSPAEREPLIAKIPDLFGLPKTASIAVAAKVGAQYATGETADYLNGLGDAAAVIALHGFAKGEQVAGVSGAVGRARRVAPGDEKARIRQLEEKLRRQLAANGDSQDEVESQLADLLAEVEAA